MSSADLRMSILRGAKLRGANLSGAYLTEADLISARGWTEEQIVAAGHLRGATMPNGQQYEEWRKSRGESGN